MDGANLELIKKLVGCTCNLQVQTVENRREKIESFLLDFARDFIYQYGDTEYLLGRISALLPGRVYEIKSIHEIVFAIARSSESGDFLVVGPCLTENFSAKKLQLVNQGYSLEGGAAERIMEYCKALPVVSHSLFRELVPLLACGILGIAEPVPYERVEQQDAPRLKQQLVPQENYEELSKMRHVERRYEYSAAMTQAVKEGNLSLAYSFLRQLRPSSNEMVRSPNPMRNAQNMCIVANTQLRYAVEECGIHPYVLDKVSGEIAANIEKLRSQREAESYSLEIIRRYCELSQEQRVAHLMPLTRLAVTYIKAHLPDNISVKSTAQALGVNANYLSGLFNREMGITFTAFVNRERVRQAAALLLHTDLPVQYIASSVGYNNSSYFAKQFARDYAMSPGSYRNRKAQREK